jgi:3-oxoacyl-[acyl-carrier-protein] synthase II
MATQKILITGAGAVTPFGLGVDALYQGMLAGETMVAPLADDREALAPGYGAVVDQKNKAIRQLPNSRDMRPGTMTRYTFLSTLALGTAIQDAGTSWEQDEKSLRRGYYIASYTNSDKFDKYVRFAHAVSRRTDDGGAEIDDAQVGKAIRKFTSFEFLKLMNNMPTAHGGIQGKCQGPCNTFLGTASAGLQAIGRAYEVIQDGLADLMYAGGTGSSVHAQMMMVRATRKLASDKDAAPATAGRPFDRAATGIVPGEGAAVLVLETEASAADRGATPQAELAGWADWFAAPGADRAIPPTAGGPVRAMRKALRRAGLEASDVDVVVALGEGSTDIDGLEASALAEVLGPKASDVPVVSLTAHIGATEAAVGPLGAALALRIMAEGKVPGTLNRDNPVAGYVGPMHAEPRDVDAKVVLVCTTTREGINAALVLKRL